MSLLRKFKGAITYWTDANARRSGILVTAQAYSGSLVLIGVIFLALAISGIFPAHANQNPSKLAFYCAKDVLYILAGLCALLSIWLACISLSKASSSSCMNRQCCSKPALTMAKALLYAAMLAVLASAVMTFVSLARTAAGPVPAPAYVYVIEVVVLLARLLLLSTLLLALITLKEAERDPVLAEEVLAGTPFGDSGAMLASIQPTPNPFMAYQPSGPAAKGSTPFNQGIRSAPAAPHDAWKISMGGGCSHTAGGYVQHMPAVPENKSQCNLGAGLISAGAAVSCPAGTTAHNHSAAHQWDVVAVNQPMVHWQPQHHYYTSPQPAVHANHAAEHLKVNRHVGALGKSMFMH